MGRFACASLHVDSARRQFEKRLPTGVGKQSARDKRATVRLEGPTPRSVAPWHHWDPNTRRYGAVSRGYIENPRSSWCALPISPAFRFIDCELGCGPLWLPHSGCVRRVSPPFRPRHQCDRYPPRVRPSYFTSLCALVCCIAAAAAGPGHLVCCSVPFAGHRPLASAGTGAQASDGGRRLAASPRQMG